MSSSSRVDDQRTARPGAEESASRGRGVFFHPPLQGAVTDERSERWRTKVADIDGEATARLAGNRTDPAGVVRKWPPLGEHAATAPTPVLPGVVEAQMASCIVEQHGDVGGGLDAVIAVPATRAISPELLAVQRLRGLMKRLGEEVLPGSRPG